MISLEQSLKQGNLDIQQLKWSKAFYYREAALTKQYHTLDNKGRFFN